MQIVVSPAGFNDWPSLLALLQEAFAYMEARIDPPSSLQRMGITELRAKAQQESLILAAEGSHLTGCAFVALRIDCAYVGKLAVAEHARGRGVARQIMAAAESIAWTNGRPILELQTRIELVENHNAFAALGFVKVAETAHPGYARPTSITMRKPITGVASHA
jgi:GNAT superfamily N-acetyltransferase